MYTATNTYMYQSVALFTNSWCARAHKYGLIVIHYADPCAPHSDRLTKRSGYETLGCEFVSASKTHPLYGVTSANTWPCFQFSFSTTSTTVSFTHCRREPHGANPLFYNSYNIYYNDLFKAIYLYITSYYMQKSQTVYTVINNNQFGGRITSSVLIPPPPSGCGIGWVWEA